MVLAKLVSITDLPCSYPATMVLEFKTLDNPGETLYAYVHKSQIMSASCLFNLDNNLLTAFNKKPNELFEEAGMFITTIQGLRCSFICLAIEKKQV